MLSFSHCSNRQFEILKRKRKLEIEIMDVSVVNNVMSVENYPGGYN
jgi:hypothetical protein